MLTTTEENYLKALLHLSVAELNPNGAGINQLASKLDVRPATVNNMVKKLKDKDLVEYEKYGKIQLTEHGRHLAVQVIRKHRLWETFLFTKLDFTWDEVHEVAEQLEHIRSQKLIDRMDEFLGFPEYDPHGDPIPKQDGAMPASKAIPLSDMPENVKCVFVAVNDTSTAFLQQLKRFNLEIGAELVVTERMPYDKSVWVKNKQGDGFQLSEKISANIFVV